MKIKVEVLNAQHKIIKQTVGARFTAEDVDASTLETFRIIKKNGWQSGWKLLLDLRENDIITKEAQEAVVRQQKAYIENKCLMVGSVVPKKIKRLQQSKLQKEANNEIDTMFDNEEEALNFLKKF